MTFPPVWLEDLAQAEMRIVLREYGYFIHRFTQFIALLIGHAESAEIRRLLLPNLIDEIGDERDNLAHVTLFENCAASCGLNTDSTEISESTREIENWFFCVFDTADTPKALAVLGPGTEEIAQNFLVPLERGLLRAFGSVDLRYFEVHRPEYEAIHISDIRHAIHTLGHSLPESQQQIFDDKIKSVTLEAQAMHMRFWKNLSACSFCK